MSNLIHIAKKYSIGTQTLIKNTGLDSLDLFELSMEIEEYLGVSLPEDFWNYNIDTLKKFKRR